ncbi:MAG: WecB/TagA/CpsF family glycosyltransferase [bacterium]|nr:WecB/TagA/CpsF family glycosyltransferase [bacterium]
MRKLQLLGIALRDYSAKESLRLVSQYLNDAKLDTICFLSTDILLNARENENLKLWLESMDLTIPVSVEILNAAGITNRSRLKEVENGVFYREFVKRLSNEKRTMFILTETQSVLDASAEYIEKYASGIQIVGTYVLENLSGDVDSVINDINGAVPDIVLSRLTSPKQEQFVFENKNKINAKIWVALKDTFAAKENTKGLKFEKLSKLIEKTIFRRMVSKYESGQGKGDS